MKKYKYILSLFLLFVIFFFSLFFASKYSVVDVREVNSNNDLKDKFEMKEIKEVSDTYEIKVYYPETKFSKVNDEVNSTIDKYINEFNENVKLSTSNESNIKYSMQVTFDVYSYEYYISYVFHVVTDLGGAHPFENTFTINYNEKKNSIVSLDNLIEKNQDLLNILSDYTYNVLKNNKKIIELDDDSMLKSGTASKKDNFLNFAFSNEGIIIFFDRYNVAPYYLGEFKVVIPYEKIENII